VIEASELPDSGPSTLTDAWEEGTRGRLHHMFTSAVFRWLQAGIDIEVPSVHRHPVTLVAKHSLPLVLKEIEAQVAAVLPDLATRVFIQQEQEFVPYSKEQRRCGEKFILMSRNLEQWAAGTRSGSVQPDMMRSQAVRATQQFHPLLLPACPVGQQMPPPSPSVLHCTNPLLASPAPLGSSGLQGMLQTIHTTSQVFVPRQRLVIAKVSKKEINFFFYNLSKDCQDRLVRQTSNLGHWFTARSSLMSSIVAQKLGLFHNQHFFRPESKANNPYIGSVGTIDSLIRHHAPPAAAVQGKGGKLAGLGFRTVYKNSKPSKPLHEVSYASERDALGRHGRQMLAVWGAEPRCGRC
jgi:hypothetical protein